MKEEPASNLPTEDRSDIRPDIPRLRTQEGVGTNVAGKSAGGATDSTSGGGFFSAAGDSTQSSAASDTSGLAAAEAGAGGSVYNPDGEKNRRFSNARGRLKKLAGNKFLMGGLAAGGGGTVILIIILVLLAGSLKIPNLSQHIAEYQFARVLRSATASEDRITYQRLAMDALDEKVFNQVKAKYSTVRGNTWGKLDKYRPSQVAKNLKTSDGGLAYETKPTYTGRQQLVKVKLGAQEFPIKAQGFTRFVPGVKQVIDFKNDYQFSKQFQPALSSAIKDQELAPIIRGLTARQIRQKLGINLVAWHASKYAGLSEEDARVLQEQEVYNAVSDPNVDTAAAPKDKKAAEEGKQLEKNNMKDKKKILELIKNNGVDQSVVDKVAEDVAPSAGDSALGIANSTFAIALGGCTIYDGSLTQSGPTINSQTASQQKAYYYLSSAGDQQKRGETNGQAVGAMNAKLGDITQSNPEVRAAGGKADTTSSISAEASAGGDLSILDAVLGSGLAGPINAIAGPACSFLLNPVVAIIGAVGGLAAAIVTGGGTEAAAGAIDAGVNVTARSLANRLVDNIGKRFVRDEAGNIAKRESLKAFNAKARSAIGDTAKSAIKVGGLTILAKIIVLSKMHNFNNGTEQGVDYANAADSGGNIAANNIEQQQFYGRPLTQTEAGENHATDIAYVKGTNQSKPAFDRYFATSNADSLLSKAAMTTASSLNHSVFANFMSLGSKVLNPLSSLQHVFGSLLVPKSLAAVTYSADSTDYGNVQWGYSAEEANLLKDDPSYSPLDNQAILDASGNEDKIQSTYGQCFDGNKQIGEMLADGLIVRDKNGNVDPNQGDCAPNKLSVTNAEFGPQMVFRWRVAHNYSNGLDDLTNKQGITGDTPTSDTSTSAQAGTTIDTKNLFDDSSSVTCADGTKDLGIQKGYTNGTPVNIRICAISNLPSSGDESRGGYGVSGADGMCMLNSRASGAVYSMVKAAKADGVTLTADSCFRTMAHQQALWVQYGENVTRVGRPGTSNHQMGLAVDFASAPGVAIKHGDQYWNWLVKNASKFGYKNYPAEAWHWSPDGK